MKRVKCRGRENEKDTQNEIVGLQKNNFRIEGRKST